MIHDTRSPFQRHRDSQRCPTCGHRPDDALDRSAAGASISVVQCSACAGTGFSVPSYPVAGGWCRQCNGEGTVVR